MLPEGNGQKSYRTENAATLRTPACDITSCRRTIESCMVCRVYDLLMAAGWLPATAADQPAPESAAPPPQI